MADNRNALDGWTALFDGPLTRIESRRTRFELHEVDLADVRVDSDYGGEWTSSSTGTTRSR
jgi:hypothetical protein